MFKNYVRIALRVLARNKTYAALNILGLGLGMACCLLIYIFVIDELSYDKFQSEYDRIYRVVYHASNGTPYARTPTPISPLMNEQAAGVAHAARLYPRNASVKAVRENGDFDEFEEPNVYCADPEILQILDFDFIAGNPETALRKPFTIIITDEMAKKYFGSAENALDKQLIVQGKNAFTVEGIVEKYPSNSHISFNFLMPYDNMYDMESSEMAIVMRQNLASNWVISHSYTYVLLENGAQPSQVNAQLKALMEQNAPEQYQLEQSFELEPMRDFYLHSGVYLPPGAIGNVEFVYTFSGIAMLTLLIACFNYINLATAQSVKRAKEVGVRKVVGAWPLQLFFQFMGESLLVAFFALVLSVFIAAASLPIFNDLTGKQIMETDFFDIRIWPVFLGIFFATSLLAGAYPSFRISRVNTVLVLKSKVSHQVNRWLNLRKVLVVGQFMLSVTLIAGALIIYQQVEYLLNRPLGFNKEAMMNVPLFSQNLNNVFGGMNSERRTKTNAFEEALLQLPEIDGVTLSSSPPSMGAVTRMTVPEGRDRSQPIFVATLAADYDFLELYEMKLLAGRDFSLEAGTDHLEAFIINLEACKRFGFGSPEKALGRTIFQEGKEGKVIGVVDDFEYSALRTPMNAVLLHVDVARFSTFSIKINPEASISAAIGGVEQVWNQHFQSKAFEYSFLDNSIEASFNNEKQLGKIISIFAALAIIVSCLGSYGLIMFSAKQREKEIGVRKVLGASYLRIIGLLFSEFTWLYAIGFALGAPLAWYLTEQWLQDFNYRIKLGIGTFLLSGVLTLLLVWLTISYRSIKSALSNPVKSLRSE